MDFEVIIQLGRQQTAPEKFTKLNDVLEYVDITTATWNNFGDQQQLLFIIKKVKSETKTHGVKVEDSIKTGERFG